MYKGFHVAKNKFDKNKRSNKSNTVDKEYIDNKIISRINSYLEYVPIPTNSTNAVNKEYVDNSISTGLQNTVNKEYVDNSISTGLQNTVNKEYVDNSISTGLQNIVNKEYVDNSISTGLQNTVNKEYVDNSISTGLQNTVNKEYVDNSISTGLQNTVNKEYVDNSISKGLQNTVNKEYVDNSISTGLQNTVNKEYVDNSISTGLQNTVNKEYVDNSILMGLQNTVNKEYVDNLPNNIVNFLVTVYEGKYYIDGKLSADINLSVGTRYKFIQTDISNTDYPFKLSTTKDGTHSNGNIYNTNIVYYGTPGIDGYTEINVDATTPITLYYYCNNIPEMGDGIIHNLSSQQIVFNSNSVSFGGSNIGFGTTNDCLKLEPCGPIVMYNNLLPSTTGKYDIGSAERKMQDLYLSDDTTIYMG